MADWYLNDWRTSTILAPPAPLYRGLAAHDVIEVHRQHALVSVLPGPRGGTEIRLDLGGKYGMLVLHAHIQDWEHHMGSGPGAMNVGDLSVTDDPTVELLQEQVDDLTCTLSEVSRLVPELGRLISEVIGDG